MNPCRGPLEFRTLLTYQAKETTYVLREHES